MSVISRVENHGKSTLIRITGRFDFNQHASFRQLLNEINTNNLLIVDLTAAEYMDSSALGLLLLLRQKAGKNSIELHYTQSSVIEKVLAASNFSRLFTFKAISS